MISRLISPVLTLLALAATVGVWTRHERQQRTAGVTIFSAGEGIPIILPTRATPAELRAGALVRSTLAKASGLPDAHFPVRREDSATSGRGIFIGETGRSPKVAAEASPPPFDTAVSCRVAWRQVSLRSERRDSIESAAAWFLEKHLGARWFMPGPLGEVIPQLASLVLSQGEEMTRPGFVSRDLGGITGDGGQEWMAQNRLERRFDHSHALGAIFSPDDLKRNPAMAPMRDGQRFIPARGDENWQPDLTSTAAVEHAAAAANRAFAAEPDRLSFSLSENDSAQFDDSPVTHAVISPPRFFRQRPDYSDLVFGFTNAVAERVARVHPDRYLPAYAYYWAENTPCFAVAPNVSPWLTADRAQWFDPAFAAEDKALIQRWTKSGARVVGAYDYFYGAPFLVPRPTLYAVTESIPFLYEAGVLAYYAETYPNWALDGPKPWLAAQLLWSPQTAPDGLMEVYYREFWAEAAPAMREFFALCERVWLDQPKPGYWIKYFQDEHQTALFPAPIRGKMRATLDEAKRLARSSAVRARLDFVSAGFAVTEAFAALGEARDEVSAMASASRTESRDLIRAARDLAHCRARFLERVAAVQSQHPLALAPQKMDVYLRNDPSARAVRALLRAGEAVAAPESFWPPAATLEEIRMLFGGAGELLHDPGWIRLRHRAAAGSSDFEWLERGQVWQASGEPAERRRIQWRERNQGAGVGEGRVLRLTGCRQEFVAQWLPAIPGALYGAEVSVRAKVSPGNQTFLIVNFLDEKQQRLGYGSVDRLPVGADHAIDLCVMARAPAKARYVGLGLIVVHQVNDDFAEFSAPSLRVAQPSVVQAAPP